MNARQLPNLSTGAVSALALSVLFPACSAQSTASKLDDAQVETIVTRSYQYVAMYNVNNKFARKQGGWNA